MEKPPQTAEILPLSEDTPDRPRATPSSMSPTGFSNHAIHLVRTLQQMTMQLSQMADRKASMLMGATFLVFTIVVGQARSGPLTLSMMVLALSAFLSALCAVYSVLPSITMKKTRLPPGAKPNKLFFGVFTQSPEDEWIDSVMEELYADETVFRTILRDIYQNGMVMQKKKYRYLGYAYRIFVVGLCVTVVLFGGEQLIEDFGRLSG
ncbi:DUF5706 domain-containing protein [Novosphingobium sp. ZN18A2]|uniref:Pycsar system effector family protein n=1 Tax=Novosphingobium sp. ZN18A2 TaxID=3079861 RepID=UPI0030CF1825